MGHFDADYCATAEDVQWTYIVALGRRPETDAVVDSRIGRGYATVLAEILASDEFLALSARAVTGDALPHAKLHRADLAKATQWVMRVTDAPVPGGGTWWTVLNAFFGSPRAAGLMAQAQAEDFVHFVESEAEGEIGRIADILPFVSLDVEWLRRLNRVADLTSADGASAAGGHALRDLIERNQQLLPFFSEGFADVYRRLRFAADVTLSDLLVEMLRAAQAGKASHWLFSADHYRHGLARQGDVDARLEAAALVVQSPYVDFLLNGDKEGIGPHPLFCHYAYYVNNPAVDSAKPAFQDYLLRGCFQEARTSVIFDPDFYIASNPSAALSILRGTHINALHHFLTDGIFADLPFSPDFDIGYYTSRYADIAANVADGSVRSAAWHFVYFGLREGRAPNPYFNRDYYRERHPTVRHEMARLNLNSEIEHFLLLGRDRGYKPERPLVTAQPAMDASKAVFQRRARRALGNVRRSPPRFDRFTSGKPAVSVIVPVFNEVEFTSRFLECAYFAASYFKSETGLGCEFVVVDNGSTDSTEALLAACPGLTIVTFDGPIGFPRAVNAGVRKSTGDIVVVANNDIEFAPDVLVRVRDRLLADQSIGVLGGLTILPNETLQEAGSFLNSAGGVSGLGRYEEPWDEFFAGVNEADYCTGSFIGFRRSDYDTMGGLDEAFSPGYYEETDFTFRMRERLGKVAKVDSSIQVTHFEHASFGKGRPPATAYALIKRNQARFAERHGQALTRRPSPLQLATIDGVRPTTINRVRLLVVEDLIPDGRLGSGFVRTTQILDGLTQHGVAFDILALSPSLIIDDYHDPLVTIYRGWMPGEDADTVLGRRASRYSHILVCRTHNLARFAHHLEEARCRHDVQIVCDTEALSILRVIETKRLAGDAVSPDEERSAIRLELSAPVGVSRWIAVSPLEKLYMERAGFGPVSLLCQNLSVPAGATGRRWSERDRILIVGAVHEQGSPNHDGLIWFMDHVRARCADAVGHLKLTLAGFWRPEVLEGFKIRYAAVDFDYVGVVSANELARLYGESRMALAPTRIAAGIACKVLEAMMIGVPIVMTDLLERQIVGDDVPSGLAVGSRFDGGESFAAWIDRLARDAEAWERVRIRQFELATPLAGADAFEANLVDFLEETKLLTQERVERTRGLSAE